MQEDDLTREMARVPGLYRPWELPQVLRLHEAFQIECAGTHEDGTPLLAVYSSDQSPFARCVAEVWSPERADASARSRPSSQPRE